jgi:hypothetical protein
MGHWGPLRGIRERGILRAVVLGIVGGLLGTVLMDIVMILTFVGVGESWDLFFSMVGDKLGGGAILGIALHNAVGMTGGTIFALFVVYIPSMGIRTMRRGLLLGLAAGLFTIPAGCIPLALWLGEPILAVIAFSALPHIVWGTVLGWTIGCGLLSRKPRS